MKFHVVTNKGKENEKEILFETGQLNWTTMLYITSIIGACVPLIRELKKKN